MHKIVVLNPVETLISPDLAEMVRPYLSFSSAYYIQGPHKKIRKETQKSTLYRIKEGFIFYSGLLSHVLEKCKDLNLEVEVEDRSKEDFTMYEPELPGIIFREDQIKLIDSWLDSPRGIIVSPTGSGKTILGFGCLSALPGIMVLWMCHTKDLMKQAYEEAIKLGFKSVGRVGDGFNECGKDITIATRQSFIRLAEEFGHLYDIVVVDEAHHVSKGLDSQYAKILRMIPAPFRLGLTATPMKESDGEGFLACTGLLGPVVGELSINEANNLGILATPKIKLLKTSIDYDVKAIRKYPEAYNVGVVNNVERNNLIAATAKKHIDKGESVLIMVVQTEHGHNIQTALQALDIKAEFIYGATKSDSRTNEVNALKAKETCCTICSVVWIEGINIPSLNVVINASGGKTERAALQKIGRGLRKTVDKDEVWIYDIFDPSNRYLIEHFALRLILYMESGWI
jgi:superfamily II DNA or RNA helicase